MREWWLRTVLVLRSPRPVFVALRRDDRDDLALRSEPVLAIVLVAGMVFVLSTKTAAHLMDDHSYDGLVTTVWTFLAGGLYGGVAYWLVGSLLHWPSVALGSQGSFRRSRHVVAFAAVPVALSFLVWLVKLGVYGGDLFHAGGADSGTGAHVFDALGIAFLAWSGCLLLIGVRAVHGWGWARAAAAATVPVAAVVALLLF